MSWKKIKVWIKSLKEEQIRDWLKYFLAMGLVLTIIVVVLSFFHGEPPLYIHGFVALKAAIFASLTVLIKNILFSKKGCTEVSSKPKLRGGCEDYEGCLRYSEMTLDASAADCSSCPYRKEGSEIWEE